MFRSASPVPHTRDRAVDLVKTVAILDVLVSHVAVPAFSMGEVGSPPWLVAMFWASISHVSVSLFLMASGTLTLAPERPMSLRKLYTKNLPRLLAALLFWAFCYQVFGLWSSGWLTPASLLQGVKDVLAFHHEEHLYYLHIMLLVYAFLPVTRFLAAGMDRHQLEYLLGLWGLLGILYPTVKPFWPFTLLAGIPRQWLMNMTYASIGYTLLGFYLTRYRRSGPRWPWAVMALAGAAMGFFGCWAQSAAAGKLDTHFIEGMGVPMCLLAAGLYGLCLRAEVTERTGNVLKFLSNASFCVFLTHIFFLKLLARAGVTAITGPAAVTVPALALALLGCGCIVYALLRNIPGVNRYLI